ncbi:MAG: hypothetical protein HZB92_03170 [Euryarchaeota archaeon]|nr:hypothetical protein [Euryarchaeota archaeon]
MEQQDKFGRPIHDDVFRKLVHYGWALENCGYVEHGGKPNLFVLKIGEGAFYADMRGTKEVPIWTDPLPLLYWRFDEHTPEWKQRRLVKQERKRLADAGCPTRLSFHEMSPPDGLMVKEDDGYCAACGKDFQDKGRFCSDECREKSDQTETTSE